MSSAHHEISAQGGGGYGPPGGPGGYGPPGAPPGGYGPPGGPGGYGPPGGAGGPGGYGPPGAPPGGYGPPGGPGGYGPPGPPYGAPFPPPGGAPLGPPGAGGSPNPELKKQATTWLIIAGVSAFLCTCCFGVIGAIFCFMAMQAADQGNLADAESKLKWGKIITIVGLVLGVLMTIGSVVVYAAEIVAALGSH